MTHERPSWEPLVTASLLGTDFFLYLSLLLCSFSLFRQIFFSLPKFCLWLLSLLRQKFPCCSQWKITFSVKFPFFSPPKFTGLGTGLGITIYASVRRQTATPSERERERVVRLFVILINTSGVMGCVMMVHNGELAIKNSCISNGRY